MSVRTAILADVLEFGLDPKVAYKTVAKDSKRLVKEEQKKA